MTLFAWLSQAIAVPPSPADAVMPDERVFLEGPQKRRWELRLLLRIIREFFIGFRTLHFVGPCVTVFGSARFPETHPFYLLAQEAGRHLAQLGFTVVTGGGPGIMEAANRGAKDVGGHSVGCTIQLPYEQHTNPYLDIIVPFRYFFVRKVMLVKYSYAFIVMPGGFGTLDECFEALTLIQTKKVLNFPVVLMGKTYWQPIQIFLQQMVEAGTISSADLELLFLTDSVEEAMEHIRVYAIERFGLRQRRVPHRSAVLGE